MECSSLLVPPPGFDDPVLPKNTERSLGPGILKQHYQIEKDGTVTVEWHFDSGKARYTPAELKDLRQAVHAFYKSDVPRVTFHQKAAALLAQGKARQALKAYSDLIQLHPNEGLHHVQMANALLAAGFGEEAEIGVVGDDFGAGEGGVRQGLVTNAEDGVPGFAKEEVGEKGPVGETAGEDAVGRFGEEFERAGEAFQIACE